MKFSKLNSNDIEEISQLFIKTFTDSEGVSEGRLIGDLTRDLMIDTDTNDLYGFVAIENGEIIGSIFFTRMTFQSGINAFLLSPVAILTTFQGKGIGQKLINYGIDYLKENRVSLIVTYGDPAFYSKVGFKQITEQMIKPPFKLSQPEGWLGLSLTGEEIKPVAGNSSYVRAFNKPELW
jgi:putative acetyltransferase